MTNNSDTITYSYRFFFDLNCYWAFGVGKSGTRVHAGRSLRRYVMFLYGFVVLRFPLLWFFFFIIITVIIIIIIAAIFFVRRIHWDSTASCGWSAAERRKKAEWKSRPTMVSHHRPIAITFYCFVNNPGDAARRFNNILISLQLHKYFFIFIYTFFFPPTLGTQFYTRENSASPVIIYVPVS